MAQLGERRVRIAEAEGSNPFGSTMSEQALYRLFRLFLQKSERAHAVALSFPTDPAALGFDLVLDAALKWRRLLCRDGTNAYWRNACFFDGGFAVTCSL